MRKVHGLNILAGGKVSQESAEFKSLQIQCLKSFSVRQLLDPWNTPIVKDR